MGKESKKRGHPGKGAIFSRSSHDRKTPIGLDHVRTAGDDCLVESAGYQGEFASVRRPFAWTKGTYTYRIMKGEAGVVEGQENTWFDLCYKGLTLDLAAANKIGKKNPHTYAQIHRHHP